MPWRNFFYMLRRVKYFFPDGKNLLLSGFFVTLLIGLENPRMNKFSTKVENLKRVPQLPLHCSQLDYNNSNQQQEQRNQQLQQQDQQQQQQNQIVSDGMSDDRDRDISGVEEINTKEVAAQITAELKRYSIPQAIFAQRVLCRSQVIK